MLVTVLAAVIAVALGAPASAHAKSLQHAHNITAAADLGPFETAFSNWMSGLLNDALQTTSEDVMNEIKESDKGVYDLISKVGDLSIKFTDVLPSWTLGIGKVSGTTTVKYAGHVGAGSSVPLNNGITMQLGDFKSTLDVTAYASLKFAGEVTLTISGDYVFLKGVCIQIVLQSVVPQADFTLDKTSVQARFDTGNDKMCAADGIDWTTAAHPTPPHTRVRCL